MKKTLSATAVVAAIALSLTACGGGSTAAADGEISYWLWDSNQLPAYQQCATDFHTANPELTIKITQRGWADYWSTLTNAFVAGTAPDVFTDHLTKFPDFVAKKQVLALDDAVTSGNIDTAQYIDGLADLWVGQDGKRYRLPKDWDTVGMFYNEAMTQEAGITEEQMNTLKWNPQDGGTYEKAIAHLTVDKSGKRGDEAGFDKNNVAVYGLGLNGSGSAQGQTEWSFLTGTIGWTHTDKNPWGTVYNFDDQKFQETIAWWASLVEKGYVPKLETTVGAALPDTFGASKSAINTNGDWTIGQYTSLKNLKVGLAPTPIGVDGKRSSMFNGLADSISADTKNPEGATKWVQYLASSACQDVVAAKAVVFPAIKTSSDIAQKAFAEKGTDVSAFTRHIKDGSTFLFPITDNAAKVEAIMAPAMDAVISGKSPASSLTEANTQVNELFTK